MCVDGAQSVLEVFAATGESKVTKNVTWEVRAMLAVRRRAVSRPDHSAGSLLYSPQRHLLLLLSSTGVLVANFDITQLTGQ